jgi:hypothetical protein
MSLSAVEINTMAGKLDEDWVTEVTATSARGRRGSENVLHIDFQGRDKSSKK